MPKPSQSLRPMSARAEFSNTTKLAAWKRAAGKCEQCGALLMGKFAYDHVNPCAFDGDNGLDNIAVLCLGCHGTKTAQHDIPAIAKSNRIRLRHAGIRRKRAIMAWRKFSGEIVRKPRDRNE